jgi:hypothetical protein
MVEGESTMTEQEEFEFRARKEKERAEPKEPTFGEKAGALAYGGVTGFTGGLGELEKFGAYEVPEFLGLREKGQRDKLAGRETIFPTVEESQKALKKVGIEKPREEVGGYQTAGEILGGFGTSLPSMVRGGTKMLVGAPTSQASRACWRTRRNLLW